MRHPRLIVHPCEIKFYILFIRVSTPPPDLEKNVELLKKMNDPAINFSLEVQKTRILILLMRRYSRKISLQYYRGIQKMLTRFRVKIND